MTDDLGYFLTGSDSQRVLFSDQEGVLCEHLTLLLNLLRGPGHLHCDAQPLPGVVWEVDDVASPALTGNRAMAFFWIRVAPLRGSRAATQREPHVHLRSREGRGHRQERGVKVLFLWFASEDVGHSGGDGEGVNMRCVGAGFLQEGGTAASDLGRCVEGAPFALRRDMATVATSPAALRISTMDSEVIGGGGRRGYELHQPWATSLRLAGSSEVPLLRSGGWSLKS
jgi:hypothetical protein